MKLMIVWQMHPGKLAQTLATFSQMSAEQDAALMGNQVRMIGRWHDLVQGRGVAIFETESAEAFSRYAMNWNGAMDLDVSVVLDDAEARAVGRK